MKKHLTALLVIAVLSFSQCLAQTETTVKDDFKPSTLNQPGQEYPQVNSQGYARFRIMAPEAKTVVVSLGLGGTRGGTPLTKNEDGSWTGTTAGPMEEGFHYYRLTVDGGTFNDPGTLNFYGSTRWESGIEIPYVDNNFRTAADQLHRAMAGLSMGGMETKSITLARPDVFSHYGLLSGGVYSPEEIKDKSKVKLIFLSCGSFERPEGVVNSAASLKEAGINAVSYVSENTRHEFQTWRRSLFELAQLLFL